MVSKIAYFCLIISVLVLRGVVSADVITGSQTSSVSFSSYLGGNTTDLAADVVVDDSGFIYIAGYTSAMNFPTPDGSPANISGSSDFFVVKLSPGGDSIIYSAFIGGSENDQGAFLDVDSFGCVYLTGATISADFPTTPNAIQDTYSGAGDAVIVKLSPDGDSILYSSYLGGVGLDQAWDIEIDPAGRVWIVGETNSPSLIEGFAPSESYHAGTEGFIVSFESNLTSIHSIRFVGGDSNDYCHGIAIGESGEVLVTGRTYSNGIATSGAFQSELLGPSDAFVLKLNSSNDSLLYLTYLGGTSNDKGIDIAIDEKGCAVVVGETVSADFPSNKFFQMKFGGKGDAFVSMISCGGDSLVFSGFLGGTSFESGQAVFLDDTGNIYVAGQTLSDNYLIFNADSLTSQLWGDASLTKFSADGKSVVYSVRIGGTWFEIFTGITVDRNGSVYGVGPTKSGDFPTVNPIQAEIGGAIDAFVVIINPELSYKPVCCATAGDSNHDGQVSVGDAIFLVKYIFADGETPFCTEEADCDSSESISIGDAAYLVKYIFSNGDDPVCSTTLQ